MIKIAIYERAETMKVIIAEFEIGRLKENIKMKEKKSGQIRSDQMMWLPHFRSSHDATYLWKLSRAKSRGRAWGPCGQEPAEEIVSYRV
jgi:hypothetical protein